MVLTSLERVHAVFVLAGQDDHRPPEPAAVRHLPATQSLTETLRDPVSSSFCRRYGSPGGRVYRAGRERTVKLTDRGRVKPRSCRLNRNGSR